VQTHFHLGDILANAITHGVGAVVATAGAAYLIMASTRGSTWVVVSCSIFAGTLVLVYLCSTLYHSLVRTRARHVFHVLDHAAIYLLIAGTYTPFTLVSLRGPIGWTLFGIVWTLAIAGIIFKSFAVGRLRQLPPLSTSFRDGL
jgi:hemolysin III